MASVRMESSPRGSCGGASVRTSSVCAIRWIPFRREDRQDGSQIPHLAGGAVFHPRFGGRFAQQVVEIETARDHVELAVRGPGPEMLRPVAIELDPVLVGIAQIERLAYAMIRSAVERNACLDEPAQGVRERR